MLDRPANHDGKRRDPNSPNKDVNVRRDVYVELHDTMPSEEAVRDASGYNGPLYSYEARGTTISV